MKHMNSIAVDIVGFALNPATQEPVMLLKRKGEKEPVKSVVPIAVGQAEAHAIITALQGVEPQRPMTHDLMTNIMMTLHASIERVDIHSYYDETFHAALTMVQNGVTFIVDARPSDAVALAVRQKVPIYLDQDVFNASSIETSAMSGRPDDMSIDKRDSRMEKVLTQIHNFSEHVQPDDFKL